MVTLIEGNDQAVNFCVFTGLRENFIAGEKRENDELYLSISSIKF